MCGNAGGQFVIGHRGVNVNLIGPTKGDVLG
jgi:hypothetical protein